MTTSIVVSAILVGVAAVVVLSLEYVAGAVVHARARSTATRRVRGAPAEIPVPAPSSPFDTSMLNPAPTRRSIIVPASWQGALFDPRHLDWQLRRVKANLTAIQGKIAICNAQRATERADSTQHFASAAERARRREEAQR